MDTFLDLYQFVEFAKANRKYAVSTANNLKSALKIFERELTSNEQNSIDIVEQNIDEIFVNVINKNKDKDFNSLNTYKSRLLKVMADYKRYGKDPSQIQHWIARHRNFTPVLKTQDKQDKPQINLSANIPTPVETPSSHHKIELAFASGKATLSVPTNLSPKDAQKIKAILDSLVIDK